jgi:hypothetical protein
MNRIATKHDCKEQAKNVDLDNRIIIIADVVNHGVYAERKPLCRIEAIALLPPEIVRELAAKRLEDIECDRGLMERYRSHINMTLS